MPHSREICVGSLKQGTLFRYVSLGEEVGRYMVVESTAISGLQGQPEVKHVNVFEIDTQGDEPVLQDKIELAPDTEVRVVGTFAIDLTDRDWKFRASDIRNEFGL